MLAKTISGNARVLLSARGFYLCLVAYLIVLFVVRAYLFPGASEDDAEQLFFTQAFAWGYKPKQPPLYTWLVLASQWVLGVGIPAVSVIKFSALFALYAFLYRSAYLVLGEQRLAVLSAIAALGIYNMGWESVMNYSNTVLLAALCAATLYAVLRLERGNTIAGQAALGLAVGLGLLSKYNYVLFLAPMAVAGAVDPGFRARLFSARGLVALAVAAAVAGPHYYWALTSAGGFAAIADVAPPDIHGGGYLRAVAWGLSSAVYRTVAYLLPVLILFLVFFPRAFLPLATAAGGGEAARRRRLFEVFFLAFAGLGVAAILAFQVSEVRTHWMMVLVGFPIYVFARVQAVGPPQRVVERFTGAVSVLAVAVVVAMGVRFVVTPLDCKKCNMFIPYADLAAQIRAGGFTGGTIVALDYPNQIGGNLRVYFPKSRIVDRRFLPFRPPARTSTGDCLVVWNTAIGPLADVKLGLIVSTAARFGTRFRTDEPVYFAEAPMARSGGRTVRLAYLLVRENKGRCT